MIAITKQEKEAITKKFPNVYIVRTMKQKSKRHHYYCEESKGVMRYISEMRSMGKTAVEARKNQRGDGNHKHREKHR